MNYGLPLLQALIDHFKKLPGVGEKTARRLAFAILDTDGEEVREFAETLVQVKKRIGFCNKCGNLAEGELCGICADTRRDPSVICVVEQPADLHVAELVRRVDEGVREVILATNPTMTGEATALYIADLLPEAVRVSRLASGLPVGGDLEYADELTLGRALTGRREVSRGQVG